MTQTPQLHTARLVLEPVRAAHAHEAWPHLDDHRMWTYFPHLRPQTLGDLRRLYQKWEHGSPSPTEVWHNWLCRERTTGELIGGMQATVQPQNHCSLIAYAMYTAHRRKGYAFEACRVVIEFVRSAYAVNRIIAEMDERNEPSYRLAEALGFVRVETHDGEHRYELTL